MSEADHKVTQAVGAALDAFGKARGLTAEDIAAGILEDLDRDGVAQEAEQGLGAAQDGQTFFKPEVVGSTPTSVTEPPCRCGHERDNHKDSLDCAACGCGRFVTLAQLSILERMRPDYARIVRESPPQPVQPEPPKKYWPKQYSADSPKTCMAPDCHFIILADTEEWPEPLCYEHYEEQCNKPPRAVLLFADGHQEMRGNFIAVDVYRDVQEYGDDVEVTWFERQHEQRERGRLVMQFYRQIQAPVDSLGRPTEKMPANIQAILDVVQYERQTDLIMISFYVVLAILLAAAAIWSGTR